MFLKKIEAQGFKSFADKTVLEFGQGATAIVGPNGSGKSNISDAIRWVMGEMSAKSLRGSSMQDIIFAGTQTRKAVNFAEVSLVLDNSAKTFATDFEEITVTRRVFRSGESAYYINKAPCRLKDIHELFMDTGLGRDGYSIIGQGNVAQILSTKAEDRRSIFEEAAGVSKYKHRKEESERKLEVVNENLCRINDIITELETQLKPLNEQSEKAKKYLIVYEEFKVLDIGISIGTLAKNQRLTQENDKLIENVADELNELHNREGKLEKTSGELYDESKNKDVQTAQMNEALREIEAKKSQTNNDITIAENNIKNNRSVSARLDREIAELQNKNNAGAEEIKNLQSEIENNNSEMAEIKQRFNGLKVDNEDIDRKLAEYSGKIEENKADTVQLMNEVSSAKASVAGIDNLRKSFLERRESVENELAAYKTGLSDTKSNIEQTNKEIEDKKIKLAEMKERIEKFNKKYNDMETKLTEYTVALNAMNIEYNSKNSKKRMLVDMENSYEGFAKSVKMVLKAPELRNISMYGTVSGLIDVDKRYVTAIETALGGAMQNIVVEREEDAKIAIEYLKRVRGGRATFLPVSSVNGKVAVPNLNSESGYIGVASELVRCDDRYRGIITNLLGRVAVVDNIDNAIAISRRYGYKFRIVTLEGDVLNSGGSMSGGSINQTGGFLSRANEIKVLTNDLSELTTKIKKWTVEKENMISDMNSTKNQIEIHVPVMREFENELIKLESASVHLSQSIENSSKQHEILMNELNQINEQLSETGDTIGKYIGEISDKESKIEWLNGCIENLRKEYNAVILQKNERTQETMEKTLKMNTLEKDIQAAKARIVNLENTIQSNNTEIENKNYDKNTLDIRNEQLSTEVKEKEKECISLDEERKNIITGIEKLSEEKENIVRKLKENQSSNKELTDKIILLKEERTRIESKKEKLQSERDAIINRLWDDYELSYSAAKENAAELEDEKAAAERIAELKRQMKSLGNVNLEAIDEYKNVKERFDFLSNQKSDLDTSKENLNKIINSMQELMEKNFEEQFKAINESFANVFNELFGGGSGKLTLSEPDNVLESGIEIEVQLPGKGLQNINLYSGGEKSFIAIALLFAILNVKPTPFCILDEIDAALDDVNVSRFATYLKNYLSTTQFIVITHRRGTMEAANVLYGVTMQEKGVSKLLSLHIDDVSEDMVEAEK